MKKIHRVLAMLMAAIMALSLITTAFAEPTIDPTKDASLSIYKYDITKASNDGAWNVESYVSTGLHDDSRRPPSGRAAPAGSPTRRLWFFC